MLVSGPMVSDMLVTAPMMSSVGWITADGRACQNGGQPEQSISKSVPGSRAHSYHPPPLPIMQSDPSFEICGMGTPPRVRDFDG
jgi:hypothetical protein